MSVGVEVELKLGLVDPASLDVLLAALPAPDAVVIQDNHYFDDAAGRLGAARIMLRVRVEQSDDGGARRIIAGAKRRRHRSGGARFEAEEIEAALDPATWQAVVAGERALDTLDDCPVVSWVRGEVPDLEELSILGTVRNHRHRVALDGFPLEVDRTTFPDGSVDAEVEIETRDIDGARRVVEAVARRAGVALFDQTKGKHRRFRERLGR